MDYPRQYHHWGIVEHDIKIMLCHNDYTDIFWEFIQPEEYLEEVLGLDTVNNWLSSGGGFMLIDTPELISYNHDIELWAYHTDPKRLTWISLCKKL